MLIYGSRDSLIVVVVRGDNHPGLGGVGPAEPDVLGPVTFQNERQPKSREGCQRAGDFSTKDHPHHFPSMEIMQSAARSSASR